MAGLWLNILLAPGKALREMYWFVDRDAKARSKGHRTVGTVGKTETKRHVDQYGRTSYTYHVTYRFEVDGRSHTETKKVGELGGLRWDDKITVYYLADSYPPKSAIDWKPQRLSDQQIMIQRTEQGMIQETGRRATGTVLKIWVKRWGGAAVYGIRYEFPDDQGRTWTNTKWVDETPGIEAGSDIRVCYLPDRPEKNTIVT